MKTVALSVASDANADAPVFAQKGEFVITETGVEGSLVYAASALIRDRIAAQGSALVHIDLLPQRDADFVHAEVMRPRGSRSLSTHLKSRLGIDGVKASLLRELLTREEFSDASRLAAAIKALPLRLLRARPLDEAISSAGGVRFEALDETLMLRALPGVHCAGEMLDWEAPTGGYLLTASMASGLVAGHGVLTRLAG
jgi:predicted flavoprotein YhiN